MFLLAFTRIPYMIKDGVNGLLFPLDEFEKLAEKMIFAIENPKNTRIMINKAKRGLTRYSWGSVRQKLLKVYEG